MARLIVKTGGLAGQPINLKLGPNRIGRDADNDFSIVDPSISAVHCELHVADGALTLRDLESTNGTFVEGQRVREAKIVAGQTIHIGTVELSVESTEVVIAIPTFINPELPPAPIVRDDGAQMCSRHPHTEVTWKCTHCEELMCAPCVHRLKRRGGKKLLLLCPLCSHAVEPIGGPSKTKKKSLFSRLGETVKMKITRLLRPR